MTLNGPAATLTVNATLELGHTTLTGGPVNALNTRGVLTISGGTGGATNLVQLTAVPVFGVYPKQIALIKYTTLGGVGYNFGLSNTPAAAPGAFLSNNVANKTIDLYLPLSPAPVITAQPQPFSGNAGDTA